MSLTKQEAKIYRLRHHSFYGLSLEHTASAAGVTPRRVQQILEAVKEKAPQLFPILTQMEAKCYHLYAEEGWPVGEIAEHVCGKAGAVYASIARAVVNGMPKPTKVSRKVLGYVESMDPHVKERF